MLDSVFYNYDCFKGFDINTFAFMVSSNVAFSVDLGSLQSEIILATMFASLPGGPGIGHTYLASIWKNIMELGCWTQFKVYEITWFSIIFHIAKKPV